MKRKNLIKSLSLALFFVTAAFSQDIPVDSLFLGQTPPDYEAKVFRLPVDQLLRPMERIAITSDNKEIYYSQLDNYPPNVQKINCYKYVDNKWQGPFVVFEGYMGPKLSPNDSVMYMQKDINGNAQAFYAKRNGAGWTQPVKLFSNTQVQHYFQMVKSGNCYLSSGPETNRDLFKMEVTGNDTLFLNLGSPVNSIYDENDFLVADDESFIILTRRIGSQAGDMYITYKNNDGKWTKPKEIGGRVNTPSPNWEYGQFLSKGNKYLFFTRGGNIWNGYYIYWVRIDDLLASLKNANNPPYINGQIQNQSVKVGEQYNYAVPDSLFNDEDGKNTLSYSAMLTNGNPLPDWLSFNEATLTFKGQPKSVANLNISVTAKDTADASVSCSFLLRVLNANNVENSETGLPESFKLFNIYPNPFNPTANIEFSIPRAGKYKVSIYAVTGKLIKTISNEEYQPGYFRETFDASGLASGMYICRLTGNNVNLSQKMIILK
jgi:hypothetical protein